MITSNKPGIRRTQFDICVTLFVLSVSFLKKPTTRKPVIGEMNTKRDVRKLPADYATILSCQNSSQIAAENCHFLKYAKFSMRKNTYNARNATDCTARVFIITLQNRSKAKLK